MYHSITIAGRMGSDPQLKYLPNGTAVCTFSLAADSGFGDKKETVWFRVTAWGKTGESVHQYQVKGNPILVVGHLKADDNGGPRIWTDNGGQARSSFEVTADTVRFLPGGQRVDDAATVAAPAAGDSDGLPF